MKDKPSTPNYLEFWFEHEQLRHNLDATLRFPQMEVWIDRVLNDKLLVAQMMDLSTRFESTRILPPIEEDEDAFFNCPLLESTVSEISYDAEMDADFLAERATIINENKKLFLPLGASVNRQGLIILTFNDAPKALKLPESMVVKTQQTPDQSFLTYQSWHPHIKELEAKLGAFALKPEHNYRFEYVDGKLEKQEIDDSYRRNFRVPQPVTSTNSDGSSQEFMYRGEWNKKIRDGKGAIIWPNGSKLEGQFYEDFANGWGRIIHRDNEYYEGELFNDLPWGQGKYVYNTGTVYEGEWVQGYQHGTGKETFYDGSVYEGPYEEGKKSGKGKLSWPNGNIYEGEFKNGQIDGRGCITFQDGRIYEGTWSEGFLYGEGTFTWPSGKRYTGEYQKDKKHGIGTYDWGDGRVYTGPFENGRQEGQGEYTNQEGKMQKGIWQQGKRIKWIREKKNI